MFRRILDTSNDTAPFIARVMLGLFILPHALQKTLGLFGGYGLEGTLGFMTSQGIPTGMALLAIAAELLGGIGLVVGFLGRIAALGVGSVMVVAALMMHRASFFVGQEGGGFELHFLAIGLAAIVILKGSGRWSVDGALTGSQDPASLGSPVLA